MRQQTAVSRVHPFSFAYQGDHPAGLWLMRMLQKHSFHIDLSHALATVSDHQPSFYALDQQFLSQLAEPRVLFPLEWTEQSLTGQVNYSGHALALELVDAVPIAVECLDLHRLRRHMGGASVQWQPPQTPLMSETQPLVLTWEWKHEAGAALSASQRWCFSGELPGAWAPYGLLQSYSLDTVQAYLCYRPLTQTTWFTAEVSADDPLQAQKQILKHCSFMAELLQSGALDEHWFALHLKTADLCWPTLTYAGGRIHVSSQIPDLRPASLKIEGYCWGLMAHLFGYLNTRYSSPEAVFHRLQHFDQKMRSVLSPFL